MSTSTEAAATRTPKRRTLGMWMATAAIAVAFISYLGYFEAFGALNDNRVLAAAVAIGAVWLLTFVTILGVRQGGMMQAVTTLLKLVPLLGLAVFGLFFIDLDNFGSFNSSGQSTFGALGAVAALTLWAFIGVESATVPAEEVEQPTICTCRRTSTRPSRGSSRRNRRRPPGDHRPTWPSTPDSRQRSHPLQ